MKTPNPQLKNTAIYVGNDAELRKIAIEYYEANGYRFREPSGATYIGDLFDNICSDFELGIDHKLTIITLPIPTTTITTEELIEYYEKNTNTKVKLV